MGLLFEENGDKFQPCNINRGGTELNWCRLPLMRTFSWILWIITGLSCFQDQTLKQILIPETGPKYLSWPSVLFSYSEHGLMFQSSNEQGGLDREPRVHYWLPGTWSFINEMKANQETSAKVFSCYNMVSFFSPINREGWLDASWTQVRDDAALTTFGWFFITVFNFVGFKKQHPKYFLIYDRSINTVKLMKSD